MNISKSKLKSKLLEILRLVDEDREIIVTDRDKPVAKIAKYQKVPPTIELFQDLRGHVKYLEDLTTVTTEEWGDI
ncbi:prevent-host-death family protein [Chondrocystis sp. NIES-4102]|nr:prevent-host-death family protein [Chondrocystis sp. NIES-4102]